MKFHKWLHFTQLSLYKSLLLTVKTLLTDILKNRHRRTLPKRQKLMDLLCLLLQ